jgi:hypothetical protein
MTVIVPGKLSDVTARLGGARATMMRSPFPRRQVAVADDRGGGLVPAHDTLAAAEWRNRMTRHAACPGEFSKLEGVRQRLLAFRLRLVNRAQVSPIPGFFVRVGGS